MPDVRARSRDTSAIASRWRCVITNSATPIDPANPKASLDDAEPSRPAEEGFDEMLALREQRAEGERRREHDADHGLGGDPRLRFHDPDQERAETQRHDRTEDGLDAEQERDADSRQRHVGDGIGRQGHLAHDREAADEAGGDRHPEGQQQLADHDGHSWR